MPRTSECKVTCKAGETLQEILRAGNLEGGEMARASAREKESLFLCLHGVYTGDWQEGFGL